MKSRYRFGVVFSILCVVLFVLFVMAIGVVTSNLDAETAYKIAANKITGTEIYEPYWPLTHETIIWEVRLPRVLLSIICGAGLAVCGVLMQCVSLFWEEVLWGWHLYLRGHS